jgi:YggT family protein
VAELLLMVVRIFEVVLIVRIILSWIQPAGGGGNQITEWIYRITEPVLEPIRRILPANSMGIDFAPIIVFVLLYVLKSVLYRSVYYF